MSLCEKHDFTVDIDESGEYTTTDIDFGGDHYRVAVKADGREEEKGYTLDVTIHFVEGASVKYITFFFGQEESEITSSENPGEDFVQGAFKMALRSVDGKKFIRSVFAKAKGFVEKRGRRIFTQRFKLEKLE